MSHSTRDTLSNQDAVTLREVPSSAGIALLAVLTTASGLLVLHGVNATHTAVGLDEFALSGNKRGSWGLSSTSQKTTHHDGRSTKSKTLHDVAHILDTTIGNTGHAEPPGKGADVVDRSGLGTADGHYLLGDASRATAHTNTETIDTSSDQASGLLPGHDVSANDVQVRELLLDPLDHLNLIHAVALAAVEDNNIEASIDELLQANLILGTGSNGGGANQLLRVRQLGGEGEVEVLAEIRAGDHGYEVAVLVDDGQLALLGLGEDVVSLGKSDTVRGRDKVSDHDVGNGLFEVVLKLEVSVGDDTQELGAELAGF